MKRLSNDDDMNKLAAELARMNLPVVVGNGLCDPEEVAAAVRQLAEHAASMEPVYYAALAYFRGTMPRELHDRHVALRQAVAKALGGAQPLRFNIASDCTCGSPRVQLGSRTFRSGPGVRPSVESFIRCLACAREESVQGNGHTAAIERWNGRSHANGGA